MGTPRSPLLFATNHGVRKQSRKKKHKERLTLDISCFGFVRIQSADSGIGKARQDGEWRSEAGHEIIKDFEHRSPDIRKKRKIIMKIVTVTDTVVRICTRIACCYASVSLAVLRRKRPLSELFASS